MDVAALEAVFHAAAFFFLKQACFRMFFFSLDDP